MKHDEEKTIVVFRKFHKENNEVIALFPEQPGTYDSNTMNSYLHLGQHGSANDKIIQWTKLATEEEYTNLKQELESLGYNLIIKQRITQEMKQNRYNILKGYK